MIFDEIPKRSAPFTRSTAQLRPVQTLVDTVTQKLRGLSFPVRARLIDLFHRHHVLVVGFSGGDLVFGADYLALSTLKGGDRGITWIVEPGKTLNPQAEAIVRGARGAAPEITLTEVFTHLGVAPAARKVTANAAAAGQAEADRRAQVRIRQWLEELGNGPLGSVLFCIALADERGWRAEANALRAAVAADLQRRGRTLPLNAIVAFNNLAGGAEQAGDYREQLRHKSESAAEQCDIAAMALGSGHTRAAVDLVLDAQASFHQDSDTQGLARCFHLLADVAAIGGRWDNAADFTRHALTLEDEIEDAAGQISSYAALSLQFIEVGQVNFAGGAATQCLARAGPGYSSRFTVIARYVLAEAHKREGRSRHARREAELARKELSTVGDLPSGSALRLWLEQRLAALPSRSALRVWLEKWLAATTSSSRLRDNDRRSA